MVSKLVYMLLWVVFLLGGWCWCPGDACRDIEKTALMQLKPFFDNIDGVNNWGKKGSNCCEWEKVECNNFTGQVIQLYLNRTFNVETASGYVYSYPYDWEDQMEQQLQWYLNVSLFLPFKELQSLYLGGNSIAGFLDHQGFEKKLEKLEILDLSWNSFNDSIFASLSELPSLKSLYLASNHFDGLNPNDGIKRLSKLKNLETLDLHDNFMFGNSIVSNLRNFTSLRSLSLQECGLQGTLEMQELNNLVNLKELYLSDNNIESLGSSFQGDQLRLKKLEVLDLYNNRFNNSILSSLTSLPNLKSLYMSYNRLEGPIRIKDINALSSLEELGMGHNQVNDFLPSQGNERLMNLKALYLGGNLFNNSILTSLGNLSKLKSLGLGGPKFQGSIDLTELNVSIHLEKLSLLCGSEDFTPTGTDDSSNCSLELQSLDLFPLLKTLLLGGFTSIQGPIIMTSQNDKSHNFSNLEEIYLEDSFLQTNFLGSIGQCTSLKRLVMYDCEMNGSLTLQELNALTPLEHLSLYCRQSGDRSNCSLELQSLALFPALKTLSLSGINFEGSIRMTSQYDKSHNFSNLEELTLGNSLLQMNFLGSIGHFTPLKRLELYNCEMNGSLTLQGLCEMTNLQELKFRDNNLEGSLPDCFSNLTSLQTLDLSHNHFSGNISPLQTLTSLQTLDLSSNQFSGNISVFGSLASLQVLSLSNNNFHIPISLAPLFSLSKLQYINADYNTIYAESQKHSLGAPAFQLKRISLSCCGDVGSFPEFLYYQRGLEYLDLSNIFFKGNQFPIWLLENNTRLQLLALANSSLSGSLQLSLASHMGLSSLEISNNFFNGSIPMKFGAQLPSLRYLNMSKNHFNGSIPSSFGDHMTSLDTLDLSNNQLSGGIPEQLAMGFPVLKVLVLSNNTLEGNIFSENFNLNSLTELHLDGNNFSGWIPDVLSQSTFLSTLDVGNNHLSGRIPRWMGNMSYLDTIIMSNNHLQGKIPIEFCQLDQLRLLDLSVNNISGSIPSCFSSSWQITQVHLSKNRLQGTLPSALSKCYWVTIYIATTKGRIEFLHFNFDFKYSALDESNMHAFK